MVKKVVASLAAGVLVLFAVEAMAQGWRGQGRVAGKVMDENNKPLEGVTVKLVMQGYAGGIDVKTNKKGEWAAGGIGSGDWQVDFLRDGYEPRRISLRIQELERLPPVEIVLKTAAPDPNQVIAAEMQKAAGLVTEKKFVEAQAIYAGLQATYPQAYQLELSVARAYHLEGAHSKEIEHLKKYMEKEPGNVEIKLLTGAEMIQNGNPDEGRALLATVDDSQVKEAAVFVNVGINLVNQNKAKDAMTFFDKAIARFPTSPDAYYYRGLCEVQVGSATRPDNPAEGDKLLAAGKADLQKFLEMAPAAPEAEAAKKLLEQLK
jgi:thioredoxin-like negative regulator of GroEL